VEVEEIGTNVEEPNGHEKMYKEDEESKELRQSMSQVNKLSYCHLIQVS
jgi:hypothetical protein